MVPDPSSAPTPRCAIALSLECDADGAAASQHVSRLCCLAAERGIRLQLFVRGDAASALRDLIAGHDTDLLSPGLVPSADTDLTTLGDDVARATDAFAVALGQMPLGLRARTMQRSGIQKQAEVQEMLLRLGFGFISSDYSTRHRAHSHDKAADDNAVRNMKHLQVRRYPSGLWEIPVTGYSDTDLLDDLSGSLEGWVLHMKACLDFAHSLGGLTYAPRLTLGAQIRHDPGQRGLRELVEYGAGLPEPTAFVTYREAYRETP